MGRCSSPSSGIISARRAIRRSITKASIFFSMRVPSARFFINMWARDDEIGHGLGTHRLWHGPFRLQLFTTHAFTRGFSRCCRFSVISRWRVVFGGRWAGSSLFCTATESGMRRSRRGAGLLWAAALACGEQKKNTLLGSLSFPTPPKPRQRDNVSTSQAKPFK